MVPVEPLGLAIGPPQTEKLNLRDWLESEARGASDGGLRRSAFCGRLRHANVNVLFSRHPGGCSGRRISTLCSACAWLHLGAISVSVLGMLSVQSIGRFGTKAEMLE